MTQARSPDSGAALKAIGVGNGPAGIAVGYGGVWVANRDDGTVTRIDTTTGRRSATRCASAAARSRSPPESARSGSPTAPHGCRDPHRPDGHAGVTRRIAVGSAPSALTVARRLAVGSGDRVARQPSRRDAAVRVPAVRLLPLLRPGELRRRSTGRCCRSPTTVSSLTAGFRAPAAARWSPTSRRAFRSRATAGAPTPSSCDRACDSPTARRCAPTDFRASIERVVRLDGQIRAVLQRDLRRRRLPPAALRSLGGHRDRRRGANDHHPPPATRRRVRAQARQPLGLRAAVAGTAYAHPRRRPQPGTGPVHGRRVLRAARGPARAQPALSLVVGRGAPRRVPGRDHRPLLRGRRSPGESPCSRAARMPSSPLAPSPRCSLDQAHALALTDATHVHTAVIPPDDLALPQRARAAVRRPRASAAR